MGEMFTLMSRDSNSHVTNLRKALILLAKMDNSSVVKFTPNKFAIFFYFKFTFGAKTVIINLMQNCMAEKNCSLIRITLAFKHPLQILS